MRIFETTLIFFIVILNVQCPKKDKKTQSDPSSYEGIYSVPRRASTENPYVDMSGGNVYEKMGFQNQPSTSQQPEENIYEEIEPRSEPTPDPFSDLATYNLRSRKVKNEKEKEKETETETKKEKLKKKKKGEAEKSKQNKKDKKKAKKKCNERKRFESGSRKRSYS